MSRLRVIVKVLPDGVEAQLEEMSDSIAKNLPAGISIVNKKEEPIAFGIKALILGLSMEEEDGMMDKIEESIRRSDHVSQLEVIGVSRESVRLG